MSDLHTPHRLRSSEVAVLLGVSEYTLYRWVKQGRFPKPIAFGRAKHWEPRVVEAWMNAAREAAKT